MARRGAHSLDRTPQEGKNPHILLALWKESFKEPAQLWGGDPIHKVQAEFGEQTLQLWAKSTEVYDRKLFVDEEEARRGEAKGIYHKVKQKEGKEEKDLISNTDIKFQESNVGPSFFVTLLKDCARQKDLQRGSRIHADIIRKSLLNKDIFVASTLVNMYAKCGALEKAHEVFDEILVRNVVSWNALTDGYAQHGHAHRVAICFQQMQQESIFPNAVSYTYILKACGSLGAPNRGKEVHARILQDYLLERDTFIGTALVDMYAKCSLLGEAQKVFDELLVRDVVAWNALITGYAQHGHSEQAVQCFNQMQREGLSPNTVSYACLLKAYSSTKAVCKGQEIHAEILRRGLLAKDNVVGNALVNMYAKCGVLAKAQEVFDGLLVHDLVSWSALITGYALCLRGEEALSCLERMQQKGFSPNEVIFLCILKACGSIGASDKGQEVHAKILKEGLLGKDIRVANAVVDMYAKCGILSKAQEVFEELPVRSVVLWTALIAGYAQVGKDDIVFKMLDRMIGEGKEPDLVTLTTVLNTCCNRGLLNEGQMFLDILSTQYGVTPTLQHYTRIVDLFGRAGHIDKAAKLIDGMPFSGDLSMWHTLLGACQKWGNVIFGRWAFEHAVQLNKHDAAAYVFLSNIYASAGDIIEALRLKQQAG